MFRGALCVVAEPHLHAGAGAASAIPQGRRGARLTRAVVVQPSAYGTDNSCTLDAVAALGRRRAPSASAREYRTMVRSPAFPRARGVRLNAASRGLRDSDEIADLVTATASASTGWAGMCSFFTDLAVIGSWPALADAARTDRDRPYGLPQATLGLAQNGLASLCDLLASGRCWVKLSGAYRVSDQEAGFRRRRRDHPRPDRRQSRSRVWHRLAAHRQPRPRPERAAPPISYRRLDTAALLEQLVAQPETPPSSTRSWSTIPPGCTASRASIPWFTSGTYPRAGPAQRPALCRRANFRRWLPWRPTRP